MSLATKIADKCNALYSLVTDTNKEVSSNIDSSITGNGYMEVSRKLDNFEFLEDANATYKVVDKNRYVKIGDKVIDTYGEELINPETPFSISTGVTEDSTNKFTWDSSANNVAYQTRSSNESGKVYVISFNIDEYTSGALQGRIGNIRGTELKNSVGRHSVYIISDTNTFIGLEAETTFVGKVSDISVKEVQTADFTNTRAKISDASLIIKEVTDGNNVTSASVAKDEYVLIDSTYTGSATSADTGTQRFFDLGSDVLNGLDRDLGSDRLGTVIDSNNVPHKIVRVAGGQYLYLEDLTVVDTTGNISWSIYKDTFQASRGTSDMFDETITAGVTISLVTDKLYKTSGFTNVTDGTIFKFKAGNYTAPYPASYEFELTEPFAWERLGTASSMSLDNPYFVDRTKMGLDYTAAGTYTISQIIKDGSSAYGSVAKSEYIIDDVNLIENTSETVSTTGTWRVEQHSEIVAGKPMKVSFTVSNYVSGEIKVEARTSANAFRETLFSVTGNGDYSFVYTPAGDDEYLNWYTTTTGSYGASNMKLSKASALKQATRDTADMFDYTTNDGAVPYGSNTIIKVGSTHHTNVVEGDFYINKGGNSGTFDFSNFDFTADANFVNLGAVDAMSLDNPYFRDREDYGATHQALAYHAWNTVSKGYEGIKTEILMNDMSVFATSKIVMGANEFTEIGSFLYQKGDYLCVPVVRTQMRNEGAYHPVYNPKGTKSHGESSNMSASRPWYLNDINITNSVADAFSTSITTSSTYGSGSISNPNGNETFDDSISQVVTTRPDGKYYDVVYANDSIDMREFAKKATQFDIALLRQDKIDNALKNEVSIQTIVQTDASITASGSRPGYNYVTINPASSGLVYESGETRWMYNITQSSLSEVILDGSNLFVLTSEPLAHLDQLLFVPKDKDSGFINPIITSYNTDLIGDPTNYPAMITDRLSAGLGVNGVYPLLVDDNGNSMLPDGGASKTKLSSKWITEYDCIYSDNGTSFGSIDKVFNSITNDVDFIRNTIGRFYMVPYETSNDPYEVTDSLPVIDVEPKVIASNSHSIYKGGKEASQVSGKITTGNGSRGLESKTLDNTIFIKEDWIAKQDGLMPNGYNNGLVVLYLGGATSGSIGHYYERIGGSVSGEFPVSIQQFSISSSWRDLGKITPEHNAIVLDNSDSAGAKWFNLLEEDDYGLHAGIYGQELVWNTDRDSWADMGSLVTNNTTSSHTKGYIYKVDRADSPLNNMLVKAINNTSVTQRWDLQYINADGDIYARDGGINTIFEVWDGTGFGDTKKFDNLSNGTSTDLNGNITRHIHGRISLNIKK